MGLLATSDNKGEILGGGRNTPPPPARAENGRERVGNLDDRASWRGRGSLNGA